jgi:hypothetical protein
METCCYLLSNESLFLHDCIKQENLILPISITFPEPYPHNTPLTGDQMTLYKMTELLHFSSIAEVLEHIG